MAGARASVMVAAVALVLVLGGPALAGALVALPNAAAFLGTGADLLMVNPHELGSMDAFRSRVFQMTFTENKTTEDGKYLVPDNTTAMLFPACEFDSSVTLLKSEYDFQSFVDLKITTFFRFMFWTSTRTREYDEMSRYFSENTAYSFEATAACSMYTLEYEAYEERRLDPGFRGAVLSLPATVGCGPIGHNPATCQEWMGFLAAYGTHVVNQIDMGGHAKMSLHIDTSFYQHTVSGNWDPTALAQIKFLKGMGQDTHGGDLTPNFQAFDKNTTTFQLGCEGGDPSFCQQANLSFPAWSASIPTNPLPKRVALQSLDEVITPAYFGPGVPDLAAIAANLKVAIDWYVLTEGRVPFAYQSDVAGLYDHDVSLGHRLADLPSLVFLAFTKEPAANATTLYAVAPSYDLCQADPAAAPAACTPQGADGATRSWANPAGVASTIGDIQLGVATADPALKRLFDAETGVWTDHAAGYWMAHASIATPDFDSAWVLDSAGESHVTALKSVPTGSAPLSEATAFLQVSFAAMKAPGMAYPLVWRFDNVTQPNPVTIAVVNGTVELHVNASAVLFGVNDAHGTPTAYRAGYWRAAAFDKPANASAGDFFDSGWFQLAQQGSGALDLFKDLLHGFGSTPEVVQVWFSPSGSMAQAYPVAFTYQGAQRSNPATVKADPHNIVLHYVLHADQVLFSAWDAASASWREFRVGEPMYWRVTALRSILTLDGPVAP